MSNQIDVLLYGLGAIGSFYAFILTRNDRVRLTVVARSNYDAVKENGIFLDSVNHGQNRFRPHHIHLTTSSVHIKPSTRRQWWPACSQPSAKRPPL
ncbi:hypothetical protein BDV26DRAFT_295798 [Aspergillus bertholletiae]|uniref:Ketopantoate reductase N-terminal domain-containing protein n=1 Tax=Aspergillus bertholletiae TaxID=1226010 RepID=A0A5N7B0K8_9EURO|nr:hypothetical protein BDV26DRAFT_295798 [Aspergillus bertholletiae]